ncbi:MAG: tRNA (N(6)-L-threonylcarbamoyladenosine(37)-C(2))-methylthiotransferase MtaB [Clostridia bacterium]|nr:tRNA (N(6)-L-threonylcarbamoyladenosine(37)-C(2))-methylthiotransferase MtaB [Clostridia bacterium]
MKKTVAFHTLGCKVNQYETEAMAELFKNDGYVIGDFEEVCDVYVINTCTVTGTGDKKSRQMIRRAQALNPNGVIAVTGCYSQVAPEEISAMGVDVILGSKDKSKITELVSDAIEGKKVNAVSDIMKSRVFEDMKISSFSEKTRAFVKIEDGCNSFCTYCIIPYARGPVRSRDLDDIISEVKGLAENGFSEVVLTGIHIASYGLDIKDKDITLGDVIAAIHEIDGIRRIRLGSIEPRILTEDFVKRLSEMPKVCNHYHISLQSGCDETLKRMNRKYNTAEYREVVNNLRKYIPDCAITTDIMVGFAGETEEEFEKSVSFLKEICFAESHVFAYSNRKGTKADKFPNQVRRAEKSRRATIMAQAAEECRQKFLKGFIGREIEVLAEREIGNGVYEGYTSNYIKVHFPSDTDVSKQFITVKIDDVGEDYVTGNILR